MIAFKRTALAQELVAALQGKALLGDAHNGLFLAAPRRTGKSTFLQGDLSPALQAAGVVVWVATRCPLGQVLEQPGSAFASAQGLSPVKARISLMLALMGTAPVSV